MHFWLSNQSQALPLADLRLRIDGRDVWHGQLRTGQQDNWGEITLNLRSGSHDVAVTEKKTGTTVSLSVDNDKEVWVVIAFFSPPSQFSVEILDRPVAFM